MFLNLTPKTRRVWSLRWRLWAVEGSSEYADWCEKSVEVTNSLHQMLCHHLRKRGTVEWKAALVRRDGSISSCFSSPPQVSCNYFLEGSWQPIICSTRRSNLWILTLDWANGGVRVIAWQSTQHKGRLHCWGFASQGLVRDGRFHNQLIILCTLEGVEQDGGFLFLSPLSEALYNVRLESFWWLCGLCLVHFLGSKHSWTVQIWLSNGWSLHIIQSNWVHLWPEIYAVGMQCCMIKQ